MKWVIFWCIAALWALAAVPQAHAAFPYTYGGEVPNDLTDKRVWMYASTAEAGAPPTVTQDARELRGVRGAHLVDAADVDQGWRTTTGRDDVTIAVLDSGIKWDDDGAMVDLRFKTRISKGEAEPPRADRTTPSEDGLGDCAQYDAAGAWDLNGDGVFNLRDYACDSRVRVDPEHGVNPDMLDPQDVLIAFTDGADDDGNGHPDDLVGWDFLDDDNDPYDDVQYGHGTGEARDSTAEADNRTVDGRGSELGTCPNCMAIHLRVGTSFIADVNRFAQAAIYATDNDVLVIQEALGTLNKSRLGRNAVDYAWEHGVTVIASAADEAAQHNNWPSSYPRVILVNSVTHTDGTPSYLQFNGCTNFNAKMDLAIPSVSCSSDATGRAAGMAGLVYSAALDARDAGRLDAHPSCERVGGADCVVSAGEVKQLMASGILGDTPVADDVNFAQTPTGWSAELTCPIPGCTDPFAAAPTTRLGTSPPRSYPARKGHDQFYGYGRVNMARVLAATDDGRVPPDVEITSPQWYDAVDPGSATFDVHGTVWARGAEYTCQVLAAPGGYPGEADFQAVESEVCDGETARSAPLDGELAAVDVAALKAKFPPGTDFSGPEHGRASQQPHSGRPNSDPYGFVVKVVATLSNGEDPLTGQDRRKLFLHRDADTLDGFPKQLAGDGEASPLLADLDGDNRNELIVANSDGVVHAWRRDGSELPGFPVHTDDLPRQTGPAFTSGAIERAGGAILASPAVGDLDRDGGLELVVADLEGKVYVFDGSGKRVRTLQSEPDWSGAPLEPFVNVRKGKLNRTQRGFLGSPVLADLDGDDGGRLEIVAAAMDRHVYAWHDGGTPVDGWPVLSVDMEKVASVDPATHRVTFKPGVGADQQQGAIVDTPAVGDIDGDGAADVVVGTNESYTDDADGGLNAGGVDEATFGVLGEVLSPANGRLFAYDRAGKPKDGWPFRVGILQAEVLPLVGEGVTGSPVIGAVPCGDADTAVGTIPAAGLAYLVGPDGRSCQGRQNDKDVALASSGGASTDQPFLAAFGHPAFGSLTGGTAFLAPVAGVQRALDVVVPEYQGGKDQLAAWVPETGSLRPGWPAEVNDLQFLTGPSVADIEPAVPGEEVVAGTSSMDLQAFSAGGTDVPGWPKLTGDWTVANPVIGTWGAEEHKVVVGLTRSGKVLAYGTEADGCSASSWPRFHHDNANSGDGRRDAVPPGRPEDAALRGATLSFTAPGDDLMCGAAERYEVRTSNRPIDGDSFGDATPVEAGAPSARAGGEATTLELSGALRRYVAVRAVDDQQTVGPVALVDQRGSGGRATARTSRRMRFDAHARR